MPLGEKGAFADSSFDVGGELGGSVPFRLLRITPLSRLTRFVAPNRDPADEIVRRAQAAVLLHPVDRASIDVPLSGEVTPSPAAAALEFFRVVALQVGLL